MVAGGLALAAAAVLGIVVVVRDAVNPATIWTIAGGAIGGALLLWRSARVTDAVAALILFLAAAPAMIGGAGWLLVPSMMLAWGIALAPRHPA